MTSAGVTSAGVTSAARWAPDERTRRALALVEASLRDAVRTGDEWLDDVAGALLARGGKRLRPALVLLAASPQEPDPALVRAATVVELLHLASLYHDDVLDGSDLRRGAASVNALWGNGVAVLAGSHLFATAGQIAATLGEPAIRWTAETADRLCTGETREVENAYNLELSVDEHLDVLRMKTGSLFQLSVGLGAALSGRDDAARRALSGYAEHLGLAFQLADDVLDLAGDSRDLGKNPGDDLRAGAYSLPVLLALAGPGGAALRRILRRDQLEGADVDAARALIAAAGALEESRDRARREADAAVACLEDLTEDEARRELEQLARFAVTRIS